MSELLPRYAPERAFPSYAFIPGSGTPHPRKQPGGHSYGRVEQPAEPLDPDNWEASADYRFAIDLFNHGYPWEAHEVLEGLWIAAGKQGEVAELLKGLIKLCAAEVKRRQGLPGGVEKHLKRAVEHFRQVPALGVSWAGLRRSELVKVVGALVAPDGRPSVMTLRLG